MIDGWKTKTGAVLVALSGILMAVSPVLPVALGPYAEWFKFVEIIMATAGAAFMGVGIAHKVEKSTCASCGK